MSPTRMFLLAAVVALPGVAAAQSTAPSYPAVATLRTYELRAYLRNPTAPPLDERNDGLLECFEDQGLGRWSTSTTRTSARHTVGCGTVRDGDSLLDEVTLDVQVTARPSDLAAVDSCRDAWLQYQRGAVEYFRMRTHGTVFECAVAATAAHYYADQHGALFKPVQPQPILPDPMVTAFDLGYQLRIHPQGGQVLTPSQPGFVYGVEATLPRFGDTTLYMTITSTFDPTTKPEVPTGFYLDFLDGYADDATSCEETYAGNNLLLRTSIDPAEFGGWYGTAVDGKPVFALDIAVDVPADEFFPANIDNPLAAIKVVKVRAVPNATNPELPNTSPHCVTGPTAPLRVSLVDLDFLQTYKQALDDAAAQAAAGSAAAAAQLAYEQELLKPENFWAVEIVSYAPLRFARDETPEMLELEYKSYIANTDIDTGGVHLTKGCPYNVEYVNNKLADNKSKWEKFVDEALNIMGAGLQAYAYIKETVASYVAAGVCLEDPDCIADTKPWITKGINVGLAAMGVPPTLPNLRVMMKGGANYLAAMAVESVVAETGLPDAAQKVIKDGTMKAIKQEIDDAVDGPLLCAILEKDGSCKVLADNPFSWGHPDPYFGNRPARLYVRVRPSNYFYYLAYLMDAPWKIPSLGTLIVRDDACLFQRTSVPVPRFLPDPSGLIIPIALTPSYVGSVGGLPTPQLPHCLAQMQPDALGWKSVTFGWHGDAEQLYGWEFFDTFYPHAEKFDISLSTDSGGAPIEWQHLNSSAGYPYDGERGELQVDATLADYGYHGRILKAPYCNY